MELPMFNRLPEYTRNEVLAEYNISNIRDIESWSVEDRIPIKNHLRKQLNDIMTDIITDLDNESLTKFYYILKKYWYIEQIDISTVSDIDCILIHNYLHGIHLLT
jgi:hypothetical protein